MRLTFLVVLCLVIGSAKAQLLPVGPVYGPVPVATVTDGDTLVVASNAGPRIVRLTGIDAPETGQASAFGTAYAAQATAVLATLLPPGTPVWLELDSGETDAYGRLLAYVYVEDELGEWLIKGSLAATADAPSADVRVRQVNLLIVDAGLATVLTVPPNTAYEGLYLRAEDRARRAGLGVWGSRVAVGLADTRSVPVTISCTLYNPDTPNDADGEWVSLMVAEPYDTTGLYLFDEGSKSVFPLPSGMQGPGELRVHNPDQGVWNNSGDVIYLMSGNSILDSWDYSGRLVGQGTVTCRTGSPH